MSYSYYPITDSKNNQFSQETVIKDLFQSTKNSTLIEIDSKLETLNNILPMLYNSNVRPINCDTSIATINEFLAITKRLSSSVEKLPLQLSKQINKYKLSIALYDLEEQALVLYSLIKMLRPICREDIDKKVEVQVDIQEQFRKILEISKQLF